MVAPLDDGRAGATRPGPGPSGLRVQLTGVPGAWVEGRWIDFRADRRFLLLARLALADDWVGRERLADLFWQETSTDKALVNLRQLLKRVAALEWVGALERQEDRLRWTVATDVKEMERAAARGDVEAALLCVRGPLLDGMDGDVSPQVATWLACERERLAERCRNLRLDLATRLARSGQHSPAAALLEAMMRADAYDEEATFAYMQVVVASGRPLKALRAYQRFSRRLNEDLGLEPCRCTRLLAEEIRREGAAARPGPPPVGRAAFPA
ncbi:MAG TPA: BTAD domain-containing putative transcriptional regulator [Trueperaceae bacterium]